MVTERRVKFPAGAADVRALVSLMAGSAAFVVMMAFLVWWAALGRDGGRPGWWMLATGPIVLLAFAFATIVFARHWAVGARLIPVAVVRRSGQVVKVSSWSFLRGSASATFGACESVPISVRYTDVKLRRGNTQRSVAVTLGEERNRLIIWQRVRTHTTDWREWAHELCGDDLVPELTVTGP